jgi:replication-associated recombination protein RarA
MDDPLYMARRLLTLAAERLGDKSENKLMGLLRAGEPKDTLALAATQIRSNS